MQILVEPLQQNSFPLIFVHHKRLNLQAEPEEGPSVHPGRGRPGKNEAPKSDWCDIQTYQNWTNKEMILDISLFNIHIYLILERNLSSHDP